ncbi:MAG TPA: hypothetical protein VFA09_24425 [Ktedonobacteraceae bacterium]|jgi:hypothetical protein|nr:hypothetical protein [Ktedonobacteraceae bacterium]
MYKPGAKTIMRRLKIGVIPMLAIFLVGCSSGMAVTSPSQQAGQHTARKGTVYYVSKNGNNTSGTSWKTAWSELGNINWMVVKPGDTIVLDGGARQMVYTTTLTLEKSGLPGAPITIKRSTDLGHNGTVVIFGGRSQPLPYCGESPASYHLRSPVLSTGIEAGNASWVTVDGMAWHGIQIHGAGWLGGISMRNMSITSGHDIFRDMEIYDNGSAFLTQTDGWNPFGPGIDPQGANVTFEDMDIHDNGANAFQSGGPLNGMLVRDTWMHFLRTFPGHPSTSYNLCTHNDGFQIINVANRNSGLDFEDDIIGPGVTNAIINSDSGHASNVRVSNVLILDPGSNGIFPDTAKVTNWVVDHVTSIAQNGNLALAGSGNSVMNSIFYDGYMYEHNSGGPLGALNSVALSVNNCQWQTANDVAGIEGQIANPEFMTDLSSYPAHANGTDPNLSGTDSYPTIDFLDHADFSLQAGSPCKGAGSRITSVSQFLRMVAG